MPVFHEALSITTNTDPNPAMLSIAGPELSLTDISALPYVLRLDHLPMMPLIDEKEHVANWYDRMRSRASYGDAISDWLNGDMFVKMSGNSAECWPKASSLLKARKLVA